MKNKYIAEIDAIFNKHSEHIFRFAITHMIATGSEHFTDSNVEAAKKECTRKEEEIKTEGGVPIMAAGFQIRIIECAQELSKIPTWELLKYIKRKIHIG